MSQMNTMLSDKLDNDYITSIKHDIKIWEDFAVCIYLSGIHEYKRLVNMSTNPDLKQIQRNHICDKIDKEKKFLSSEYAEFLGGLREGESSDILLRLQEILAEDFSTKGIPLDKVYM